MEPNSAECSLHIYTTAGPHSHNLYIPGAQYIISAHKIWPHLCALGSWVLVLLPKDILLLI